MIGSTNGVMVSTFGSFAASPLPRAMLLMAGKVQSHTLDSGATFVGGCAGSFLTSTVTSGRSRSTGLHAHDAGKLNVPPLRQRRVTKRRRRLLRIENPAMATFHLPDPTRGVPYEVTNRVS